MKRMELDPAKEKKKKPKKLYKPLISKSREWPVVQLARNRKEFVEEVMLESVARIKEIKTTPEQLREEIETTVYRERMRMKQNPWRVDPPDELAFWDGVKEKLVDLSADPEKDTTEEAEALLKSILSRYSNEIAGNFKPSHYRLTRELVKFGLTRLLNASRLKGLFAFFKNKYTLNDKINIVGKKKKLRKLAMKGTVVMVPTHFSNLDSILIGWVIHALGLPPFIYGAGLNLFNIKIIAYFMNSLGAYKVDRRKINLLYLESLKTYSNLAMQKGAHSLFFPGGTRSRSGAIEDRLKLGLLGSAMEAQRYLYSKQEDGQEPRKIFIVPVVINYHFVLEAPLLINEYLKKKGQERYLTESDEYSTSFKMLKFIFKFFTKGSDISVSIGDALDILGNRVDSNGNSLDAQGRIIDTRDYFLSNGVVTANKQREDQYTRMLSETIVKEYHRINRVFASHLASFVAFEMMKKKYPKLDFYNFLRLPEEDLEIPYEEFKAMFEKIRKKIFKLKKEKKINVAKHMLGETDETIKFGVNNVGMYHMKRPLKFNKAGNVITEDLTTLYFYRNRLDGYELEKYIE
jgi:glycerol-3-phosphate O-acyltransferase